MQAQSYQPADEDQRPVIMPDLPGKQATTGSSGATGRATAPNRIEPHNGQGQVPGGLITLPLPVIPVARARNTRRARLALVVTRAAGDGVLLVLAFAAAYWLRYGLAFGRDLVGPESFRPFSYFYPYMLAYAAISLIAFQARGLYALPRGATWFDHARLATSGVLIGVSALTLGALLFNPVLPSRLLFIFLWFTSVAIFAAERFAYRSLRVALWRRGINIRRALIVGAGVAGQRIMKDIAERPDLGYTLAGYLSDNPEGPGSTGWQIPIRRRLRDGNVQRLGALKDLERAIAQQELHEVIVTLPATHHQQILRIIDSCRSYGLEFKLVPDLFEMRFNEVRIDAINGVPLIGVKDVALRGFNLLVKRVLDVLLAAGALILLSIPVLIISILVKVSSPGPVFFKQVRVGKGGRLFTCYKFRSMYRDAEARLEELRHLNEADGPIFKIKDDPRLTPFGKILRRTSIDELPQIFNIFLGDMSWVGPRPPTPNEVAEYSEWHKKRLDVMPGLTGLWQVSGRSDLSFDEMVKLDLYYAENWSLALDTRIILQTIPAVLKREGAY